MVGVKPQTYISFAVCPVENSVFALQHHVVIEEPKLRRAMLLKQTLAMDAADVPRRALDDVGQETTRLAFFDDSLHHVRAVSAPFRDFDERILLLKLLGDGLKPGMRVIENNLSFPLCALNEKRLPIGALINRKLRNGHGCAGGKRICAGEN